MYITDDPDEEDLDQWTPKKVPGNETSVTLDPEDDGLEPGTEYTAVVRPTNDKGDGPASDPVKFTPKEPSEPTEPGMGV